MSPQERIAVHLMRSAHTALQRAIDALAEVGAADLSLSEMLAARDLASIAISHFEGS